jgi:3D (Asp-Asp-Asp) domain-containing protein
MFLSRSLWRKLVVLVISIAGFVLLYEATIFDSKHATRQLLLRESVAESGSAQGPRFTATAYCKGQTTSSGVGPRSGVAAADASLLPVGSVIQVLAVELPYSGVYTVMDTGPTIRGRNIDIYMWSCTEALRFGRQPVDVVVLRLGWDPRTTIPNLVERFFGWRERSTNAAPPEL